MTMSSFLYCSRSSFFSSSYRIFSSVCFSSLILYIYIYIHAQYTILPIEQEDKSVFFDVNKGEQGELLLRKRPLSHVPELNVIIFAVFMAYDVCLLSSVLI